MTERRKLFSSTPVRRKLFSDNPPVKSRTVICMDCGYVMTTNSSTAHLYCPKCGGKRFNVVKEMTEVADTQKKSENRRSLFEANVEAMRESGEGSDEQKEFSEPSDELEEKLKTYSGKIISEEEVEKVFSDTGYKVEDLIEKGFARITDDDQVKICDSAFLQSKLFSKLIISVTKILDLDPVDGPKKEFIDMLAEKKCMEPKSVMLIKKAHSISPIIRESGFSETDEWIKDSGIQNDLHLEFGGSEMELSKFKEILSERYDDAPEDVIDKLSDNNIIKVQGDIVEVL